MTEGVPEPLRDLPPDVQEEIAHDIEQAVADLPPTPTPRVPLPLWFGKLALLCAVLLVPWTVYLAFTLPRHARAAHYDVAWVGFDAAMFVALLALAVATLRRSPLTGPLASVSATLLVVDAWFDMVTSARSTELMQAVLSAVFIELPLAALCTWVAVNAERLRARGYRRLWRRSQVATVLVKKMAARDRV